MQQKATRYRSLAAAGHLPVPQPPPQPVTRSRFFNPRSGAQRDDELVKLVGDMLELTALSAAYLVAHPEEAAKLSAPGPYGAPDTSSGAWADMQQQMHYNDNLNKIYSGGCKPPVGCW